MKIEELTMCSRKKHLVYWPFLIQLSSGASWCFSNLAMCLSHILMLHLKLNTSFSHKGYIDQESLGVLALSENTMIGSKRSHQTSNSRS